MQQRASLEPPSPPPRACTFASLSVPSFRVLWAGTWASYVPFFMAFAVNSVVAFELAGVNRAVGTVSFAQGLAMVFLAPLGGAAADRWPRRRLLALSQSVSALVFGTFALLLALDRLTIGAMALGSFALGVSVSFLGPARTAYAVELVGPELRGNAVALNQLPLTGSQVLGPALAGLLLASPFGAVGAYALMSALYVVSALSLAPLPRSVARHDAGETHIVADLVEGLRYLRGHRRLRLLVLFFVSVIMLGFSYGTVLPGLVSRQLAHPLEAVPPLYFTSALAGLCMTFVTARIADSRHALPTFTVVPFVFALGLLCLASAPAYPAAVAAMALVGLGFGGFQTLNAAVIVRETEPAYLGRIFSLSMLAFAGNALMSYPTGLLADAIGERATLGVLCTAVVVVAGAISLRLRTR